MLRSSFCWSFSAEVTVASVTFSNKQWQQYHTHPQAHCYHSVPPCRSITHTEISIHNLRSAHFGHANRTCPATSVHPVSEQMSRLTSMFVLPAPNMINVPGYGDIEPLSEGAEVLVQSQDPEHVRLIDELAHNSLPTSFLSCAASSTSSDGSLVLEVALACDRGKFGLAKGTMLAHTDISRASCSCQPPGLPCPLWRPEGTHPPRTHVRPPLCPKQRPKARKQARLCPHPIQKGTFRKPVHPSLLERLHPTRCSELYPHALAECR